MSDEQHNDRNNERKRKREDSNKSPDKKKFKFDQSNNSGSFSEEETPRTPDTQPMNNGMIQGVEPLILQTPPQAIKPSPEILLLYEQTVHKLNTNQAMLENGNLFEFNIDMYSDTEQFQVADTIFKGLCEAIQANAQIEKLEIRATQENPFSREQMSALANAARNTNCKSVNFITFDIGDHSGNIQLLKDIVVNNSHLTSLKFSTTDFTLDQSDVEPIFANTKISEVGMHIKWASDFKIVYGLIEHTENLKKIFLENSCGIYRDIDQQSKRSDENPLEIELNAHLQEVYPNLNYLLKNKLHILNLEFIDVNLEMVNTDSGTPRRKFLLLLKRNNDVAQFPQYQNLILTFYSQLSNSLAANELITINILPNEKNMLDYLDLKASQMIDINTFNDVELKVLDKLLEAQLDFVSHKLSALFSVSKLSSENCANKKSDVVSQFNLSREKANAVKTLIAKRGQSLPAAKLIGKSEDFYKSVNPKPNNQPPPSSQNSSNWFGM